MIKNSNLPAKHRLDNLSNARRNTVLTLLGLAGLLSGCRMSDLALASNEPVDTATPPPTVTPRPTGTPTTRPPTPSPTATFTATPWPSPTSWPTATPWVAPAAWSPARLDVPALEQLPVLPTATLWAAIEGSTPINYSPPNEVDVFGNVVLHWDYPGSLADDEFFDIKIKPLGSESSAFVDWTKNREYELRPWQGWTPGLYTWQIGIVKGRLVGETKEFIADTGRDSSKFVLKWQAVGHGGGGENGGGSRSGGS